MTSNVVPCSRPPIAAQKLRRSSAADFQFGLPTRLPPVADVVAHNPFAVRKPQFVEQVVVEAEDPTRNSLLVVDYRDERLISPFQHWLVDEIMSNTASSINVLTEGHQLMPPYSGYHCSVFANYTLDGIKAVTVFTMSSRTGGPCAQWDSYASSALSHSAFQPLTRPAMFDTSAAYVDVKVFNTLGVQRVPIRL